MLQPIKKIWNKYGVDHPRNRKYKNIWQGQYKIRRIILARLKKTFLYMVEKSYSQSIQAGGNIYTDIPGVKNLRGWRG